MGQLLRKKPLKMSQLMKNPSKMNQLQKKNPSKMNQLQKKNLSKTNQLLRKNPLEMNQQLRNNFDAKEKINVFKLDVIAEKKCGTSCRYQTCIKKRYQYKP